MKTIKNYVCKVEFIHGDDVTPVRFQCEFETFGCTPEDAKQYVFDYLAKQSEFYRIVDFSEVSE